MYIRVKQNRMYMKKKLLSAILFLFALNVCAQEIEVCDSIDLETGIVYRADGTIEENPDTVSLDSVFKPSVAQIPLDSCDSLMVSSPGDRYGVIWKGGKCGIYDISKWENVTNIEYRELWFSFRREMEGEYFTYFGWDEVDKKGVIGVAETNNTYVAISFPKNDEEGKEDER